MKTVKEIRHSIRTYIHGYNVKRNNGRDRESGNPCALGWLP
jgi:hypothetical protein